VKYDVVIVGAGPAGLFAAYELCTNLEKSPRKLSILLIDKGRRAIERQCYLKIKGKCMKCRPCNIMCGIGGAGTLSSGTINLRPDIGGDLHEMIGSWDVAEKLVYYVDSIFVKFGAPDRIFDPSCEEFRELQRKFVKVGAQLVRIKQRHIGTDNTPRIIENMTKYIEEHDVKIATLTEVFDVEKRQDTIIVRTSRGDVECSVVLMAPGRSGAEWFKEVAKKLGIQLEPNPLDIGVRVEVPYYVMEPLTKFFFDPKIIVYTKTYDDKVRTFCTNPGGFVIRENYDDGTVGVNGETYTDRKSKNTNFALLVSLRLTDPLSDTIEYGKAIARMVTKLGDGRPIIQRLGDLRVGRRSTWDRIRRSIVEPTLKEVAPGDIALALPHRVVTDLLEALDRIDEVIPGVASSHTLLYAPEIKYYSMRAVVNRFMETTVENVFAAGDGAGLSRGINIAAATGVIAAWGILNKFGIEITNPLYDEYEKVTAGVERT